MTKKTTKKTNSTPKSIPRIDTDETTTKLCPNCKDVVIFIKNQDHKTCPSCGTLVENIK